MTDFQVGLVCGVVIGGAICVAVATVVICVLSHLGESAVIGDDELPLVIVGSEVRR